MRLEIMQRAMEAFAAMDIEAAKRCLSIVEVVAEAHPKPDMTHLIDQPALHPYKLDGMTMVPVSEYYAPGQAEKAPIVGAVGIDRLSKPEFRPNLN